MFLKIMDFSNVNTDAKGYAVPVASTVELEDINKPPVQPVPEDGKTDTVDLDDKALHGRKGEEEQTETDSSQQESAEQIDESAEEDLFSTEELEEAVEEIQKHFQAMSSTFTINLKMHQNSEIIAELRDTKTNEVVKQISAQEIVQLRKKLVDMTGLLFDKEV